MSKALVVQKERLPQSQRMYRAAQYVRMSTDYQQYSIENQAAVIAAYAELHKLTIVRTFRDEGERGLNINNRRGLSELIDEVRSGRADFSHLLVFDISRWGRFQDVDESAHYEFICRKAGVKVVYCAEQFDNDGSLLSSIIKNIKRVMAAEFSRELSGKVHAGALRLASLGFKMGGTAAYGLERRVIDEKGKLKGVLARGARTFLTTDRVRLAPGTVDQIKIVKWIFQEYLRGRSQRSISRELNQRDIRTNRGGPWRQNSISALLRNESYIGTLIYNRDTEKLGARRTHNPKELWVRTEGAIEPIIERDQFALASRALAERRVCISEEEMLIRLRKLLMKKGRLSAPIIDSPPGLPSLTAYLVHFGTLRNLYRLIGYTGNDAYWTKLAAHNQWVESQLKNAAGLGETFAKAGMMSQLEVSAECLRIEGLVNVCFRVAKWRKYAGRPIRWTLVRRVRWPDGWVVAARLGENNKQILDYVLLQSSSLRFHGPLFWFSDQFCNSSEAERFDSFEELSRVLVKRVKRELSAHKTKRSAKVKPVLR